MFVNSTFSTLKVSPLKTFGILIGSALTLYAIYRKYKDAFPSQEIFQTHTHTLKVTRGALLLKIELIGNPKKLDDNLRSMIAKAINNWCNSQQIKLSDDLPDSTSFDSKETHSFTNKNGLSDLGELICGYSFNPSSYTFWINGSDESIMRLYRHHADNLIKHCRHDLGITKNFFT